MSKPISSVEMKDWVNETWQKCLDKGEIMTDFERGYEQGKADAKKSWVGLTNEEIKSLPSWWPSYEDAPALVQLVKDVEANLRKKNEIRHP
jgi:hypothetical protein